MLNTVYGSQYVVTYSSWLVWFVALDRRLIAINVRSVLILRPSTIRRIQQGGDYRDGCATGYTEENARIKYVAIVALYSGKTRCDNWDLGSCLALEAATELVSPNPASCGRFRRSDSSGEAVA
jgi:hypothetical protein